MIDASDLNSLQVKRAETNTCDAIILSDDMRVVQIYAFIMIIFALISCLCAAYYACFGPPSGLGLKILDATMEVCFGIDIVRNFLMQYEDIEENKMVRNLKLIAKRYIKGDFIVDIIAISRFPLHEIFKDSWTQDQLDLLYLLRLFRLYKVLFLLNT